MPKLWKFIFLALVAFSWTLLTAQENTAPDSTEIPGPVDSLFIENKEDSSAHHPERFEINLGIEKVQSPEVIGEFLNSMKYNLSFNLDTIQEGTREYVADMRARRAMRSVIYNVRKPIPPNEMPFIIQFQNNIFTGFKPVLPLLQFGF
jgi:hypothetical protein